MVHERRWRSKRTDPPKTDIRLVMTTCALLAFGSLCMYNTNLFNNFDGSILYNDIRVSVPLPVLPNFTSLLIASGSDKYHRHHYERYYERWLEPYRDVPGVKVLEIGANQGHSLKLWEDYFADPDIILGLKYGNAANGIENKIVNLTKVSLYTGDQSSKPTMDYLSERGPWHIIIDDGSHVPQHVIYSLVHLWDSVAPGGMYIVEDLETSYWPNGSNIYGYPLANTGVLADANHSAAAKIMQLQHILVRHQIGARDMSIFPGDDTICSIEWGMNLLAIRKCGLPTDGVGPRYLRKIFDASDMRTWLKQSRSSNPKD